MADRYRWVDSVPRIRPSSGETFKEGDEIEPTDHELRAFPDRLEAIEEALDHSDGESDGIEENTE